MNWGSENATRGFVQGNCLGSEWLDSFVQKAERGRDGGAFAKALHANVEEWRGTHGNGLARRRDPHNPAFLPGFADRFRPRNRYNPPTEAAIRVFSLKSFIAVRASRAYGFVKR